jgi:hypothetical protein
MSYQQHLSDYVTQIHKKLPLSTKLSEDKEFAKRYNGASWLKSADCNFLMSLCWIARTPKVQFDLWDMVRPKFISEYHGDIRNILSPIDCQKLGYYAKLVPYNWLPNLSKYLREHKMTFSQFLDSLKALDGIETRNKFAEVLEIESLKAKRISVFIRDFLEKNVFPIDSNVAYVLSSLGLPNDEELMVKLCEKANVDPKKLERQLYALGQEVCGYGNQCNLKGICISSVLNIASRCYGRRSG